MSQEDKAEQLKEKVSMIENLGRNAKTLYYLT